MIASNYKKLAADYGMLVDKGVAYGSLGGFAATLSEGSGWKQIVFTTTIADSVKALELQTKLNGLNLREEYRVTDLKIAPKTIQVVFHDNPGTMKKIRAFLAFFLPLLEEAGATKCGVCAECGMECAGGCWKLIGGVAYYMHTACAEKVTRDIMESEQYEKENRTGNYFTGLIGALLGAAIGAVLWAVVLYFGYVASIIGLAVGFLAEKGYNLFRGKQGRGKVLILILAVIFGVVVGNLGADVIALVQMIASGELVDYVYADIPLLMLVVLLEDPEYLMYVLGNMGLGLLFAGLGVWSQMRRVKAEVSGVTVADLK